MKPLRNPLVLIIILPLAGWGNEEKSPHPRSLPRTFRWRKVRGGMMRC